MIWPQSGDSVDLLTTDEKLKGMEVLARTTRKLSTTALCLGVQARTRPKCSGLPNMSRNWHRRRSSRDRRTRAKRKTICAVLAGPGCGHETARLHPDDRRNGVQGASPVRGPADRTREGVPRLRLVEEEPGNVIARTRALLAAKPPIRRVFSARGGFGWLYELRLGSEGLIARRSHLRRRAHPHLATAQERVGSGSRAQRVQQIRAHDQPRDDPSRGDFRGYQLYLWKKRGCSRR